MGPQRNSRMPAEVCLAHPTLFTSGEIEAYERQILANTAANEHDASRFLRQHPKFLYLGSAADVRPEVTFQTGSSERVQRVDFFRRKFGDKFWDIVELKHPNKPFVVKEGSQHARLSADVDIAINQAQDYRDLLDRDGEARRALAAKGIYVWRPQIMVIVGKRDEAVEEELLYSLLDRVRQRGPIEVWSYTGIYDFAKEHYERNRVVCIPALHLISKKDRRPDGELDYFIDAIADTGRTENLPGDVFSEVIAYLFQTTKQFEVSLLTAHKESFVAFTSDPSDGQTFVECRQCSQDAKIDRDSICSFLARVKGNGFSGGAFVTDGTFSDESRALFAHNDQLEAIDQTALKKMLAEHRYVWRFDPSFSSF